jgi:hypothetical protein
MLPAWIPFLLRALLLAMRNVLAYLASIVNPS